MQYFLVRHAIPLNSKERECFKSSPRIFANSIPKAGTNLLKNLFHNTPGIAKRWTYQIDMSCPNLVEQLRYLRNGQVVTAHLPWARELIQVRNETGMKLFLIIRDPRDIVVSNTFYIWKKDKSHRLHQYFTKLNSFEEGLSASILGIDGQLLPDGKRSKSIGEHIRDFLPWIDEPECLVVKFEDLVGEKGGGSDQRQLQTVHNIIKHLEVSVSNDELIRIAKNVFSPNARTFRRGVIGDWRNHFSDKHVQMFKENAGNELIKMRYEDNFTW